MDKNQAEAGFRSTSDDNLDLPLSTDTGESKLVRLSEVRQLIVPIDAALPEVLDDMVRTAVDLAELGHVLYESDVKDEKVIFLLCSDALLSAAFNYPGLFRLQAAVVRGIPGAQYSPLFNQATFGVNELSWGYLVDTLHLDDRLNFDVSVVNPSDEKGGYVSEEPSDEPDAADGNMGS